MDEKVIARFWAKVRRSSDSECWEWTASRTLGGYGQMEVAGKFQSAHRMSWVIAFGAIPDDMCVLHKCDNPRCVNPNHLFLGDTKDNVMDRERKGRGRSQHSNLFVRKFTDDQIAAMRADKLNGVTTAQLMAKYGISRQYVQRIVSNKRRRITTSQKDGDA